MRTSRIISVPLLSAMFLPSLWGQATDACLAGSHTTTIFYVNGIFTDETTTKLEAQQLSDDLKAFLPPATFASVCVTYAWNAGGGSPVSQGGELVEAATQALGDDLSSFFSLLANIDVAPSWLKYAYISAGASITSSEYVSIQDLASHVQKYQAEIDARYRTVIVVAHSQGNFFANESFKQLVSAESLPDPVKFNIVSVATPAATVEGYATAAQLPYTTLCEDFIWKIPAALSENIYNSAPLCALNAGLSLPTSLATIIPVFKHSFLDSYLAPGTVSRNKVLSDIAALIPVPASPKNLQLTISPTGQLPAFDIACTGGIDGTFYIGSADGVASANVVLQRSLCSGGTMHFAAFDLQAYISSNVAYPDWLNVWHLPIIVAVKNTSSNAMGCSYPLLCNLAGAWNSYRQKVYLRAERTFPTLADGPEFSFDGSVWTNTANGDGSLNRR